MHIILNAFSFLRVKLTQKGFPYLNASLEIKDGTRAVDVIDLMGLEQRDVEAVFVNHLVVSKETKLKDGDRVALIPPGTPGSYRLVLGMKKLPSTHFREESDDVALL